MMGWETVARCDVCKKIKGEGNKWLIVNSYVPTATDKNSAFFTIYLWSHAMATASSIMICGEECLNKRQREFLDLRSKMVEPEQEPPAYAEPESEIPVPVPEPG